MPRVKEGATLWHEERGVGVYTLHFVSASNEGTKFVYALCHCRPVTRYGACIYYESNCSGSRQVLLELISNARMPRDVDDWQEPHW